MDAVECATGDGLFFFDVDEAALGEGAQAGPVGYRAGASVDACEVSFLGENLEIASDGLVGDLKLLRQIDRAQSAPFFQKGEDLLLALGS